MYLVISLTVADMFVGGFSLFTLFQLLSLYSCDIVKMNLSQELIVIITFLFVWFPLTSLTNIVVISIDRMHATIRPFRHRLVKKWVYGVTIAGVWVLAAMVSTVSFILKLYSKEFSYHFYFWQSYCCLGLFVICVSYSSIAIKNFCVEGILSTMILYLMNSLVNPIVYTIRIPEFRKALLLLFKRQRRQNAQVIPLHAL
ncbi:unnamed protein product [Porites evermanni]|uniref:G-protein coupled receptors family 1 profile domain-containing protein n=1 Tax=Porites evermanni TaxID=104178 RepID=A0ABN8T396_9CNID|nr:unnamed protein product [Porites evermanni]